MKRPTMVLAVMLVLLSACGGGATSSAPQASSASGGTTAATSASGAAGAAASAAASTSAGAGAAADTKSVAERQAAAPAGGQQAPPAQGAATTRLVIRTATQAMIVQNVDQAAARVRQVAAERGGYVLNSQANGDENARSASITIKVPAASFNDTLAALGSLAQKVEDQQVQGQDVTDEFVDLQARLRNLRTLEARLLQFLRDAKNVEDSLRVSQELSNTQGQIEQTEGRINYLQQSAALATITVSLRSIAGPALTATTAEWSPLRTAREALGGVISFGQAVATLAIVVAVWLPVWGPLVLVGMWLWRRGRRLPTTSV